MHILNSLTSFIWINLFNDVRVLALGKAMQVFVTCGTYRSHLFNESYGWFARINWIKVAEYGALRRKVEQQMLTNRVPHLICASCSAVAVMVSLALYRTYFEPNNLCPKYDHPNKREGGPTLTLFYLRMYSVLC